MKATPGTSSVTIRNVSIRNPDDEPVAPGRPRDPAKERTILAATLDLLDEGGYTNLTIAAVAARSGAAKNTIYRRWANKRELVAAAAITAVPAAAGGIDTGTLAGDLTRLCQLLRDTLLAVRGSVVLALLDASSEDPRLGELIEQWAGTTGARLPAPVLDRAIDRGELPRAASSFAFDEVAGSALVVRALNGLTLDDRYLRDLVDRVLIPALRHVDAGPPSTHPIFRPDTGHDDDDKD